MNSSFGVARSNQQKFAIRQSAGITVITAKEKANRSPTTARCIIAAFATSCAVPTDKSAKTFPGT